MAQLIISKQHVLGPCEFKLEVYQELGGSKDTVPIGSLTINLSEYASSGLTTRRYLLDHCKFNSTIKVYQHIYNIRLFAYQRFFFFTSSRLKSIKNPML